MIRIGFVWHSLSTGNLGVGALSVSNLLLVSGILKDMGEEAEYVVFGPKGNAGGAFIPELPSWRYVTLSFDALRGGGFLKLLHEMNGCDLILDIGSGDSFSDIYGTKRFLKMMLSKFMLKKAARKLVLSPQTIGPFNNILFRRLAARTMGRARKIFVRDRMSYEYAASIAGGVLNLALNTDVAMSLPQRTVVIPELQNKNGLVNVGLNVSGLLYNGGYKGGNQFGLAADYRRVMHVLSRVLVAEPGVRVWLVPHVLNKGEMQAEDDYGASQAIASDVPDVRIAPQFADPIAAKSFIAQLDFFTGARMHATIAAFSSGVPVIPLAYSRKFAGLYESLGYMRVVDMRNVDSDALIATVMDGYRQRDVLRQEVAQANQKAQALLSGYRDYLHEVLRDIAGKR